MDTHGSPGKDGGTAILSISGMTCDGCAKTVTRVLSRVPGVSRAKVDFATNRAVVTGSAHSDVLIAAVQAAGYGAQPMGSDTIERGQNERGGSGCC